MKLIASLIVKNELGRYLLPCLAHLLTYCDEVRILDDGSTDDWADRLRKNGARPPLTRFDHVIDLDRIHVLRDEVSRFFYHEGAARNALLDWTLLGEPTHILAIDADEFVTDGPALRAACEQPVAIHSLDMEEVWRAEDECLCVRMDGGWRPHPIPILFTVPRNAGRDPQFRIQDSALACGREPMSVRARRNTARPTGAQILHFGWANESERVARHHRYAVADGGRFHASTHLDSILWPDEKVVLGGRDWPEGLDRPAVLAAANTPR